MGSHLCLAMRSSSGQLLSALSYSHVLQRIHTEIDLTVCDETEIENLILEYRNDPSYGTIPLAPVDGGILFFDFPRRRIINGQSIAYFPAITRDGILRMLSSDTSSLNKYAPLFHRKITVDIASDLKMHVEETEFDRADTMEEVWRNAGIDTRLMQSAGVSVPSGMFHALMFDVPGWQVATYDRESVFEMSAALTDVSEGTTLSVEDVSAWTEFTATRAVPSDQR